MCECKNKCSLLNKSDNYEHCVSVRLQMMEEFQAEFEDNIETTAKY